MTGRGELPQKIIGGMISGRRNCSREDQPCKAPEKNFPDRKQIAANTQAQCTPGLKGGTVGSMFRRGMNEQGKKLRY